MIQDPTITKDYPMMRIYYDLVMNYLPINYVSKIPPMIRHTIDPQQIRAEAGAECAECAETERMSVPRANGIQAGVCNEMAGVASGYPLII